MRRRPESDLVYLLMILESTGKIVVYSNGFKNALLFYKANDQLNFNATLLLLANIGEQVVKISDETKNKYPDLFWGKMKGFRNRIVHDYAGIDFEMVFDIIKIELPILKNQLEILIREELSKGIFNKEDFNVAKESDYYNHVAFENIYY
ncbi:MAG TPA: HepT-like ribonuclease domain-containing protein [Flavobacteriaceae bacterium]|nr:HepT-like ribonuclease domain-containing protein [Flavobacteriaceae bacterium]